MKIIIQIVLNMPWYFLQGRKFLHAMIVGYFISLQNQVSLTGYEAAHNHTGFVNFHLVKLIYSTLLNRPESR